MSDADTQQHEASRLAAEADRLDTAGARREALSLLWQAVLRYAEVERLMSEAEEPIPLPWQSDRAQACRLCAEWLADSDAHAEAANVYQEAVDLYGSMPGQEAEQEARHCARQALASIAALRSRPYDRLYLLIAHHERQQQQLALRPGTEPQQAACCTHIAQVFMRRDRPQEAVTRYLDALHLYARAVQTTDILLATAECHHRIGGLLANALHDLPGAVPHYRAAITLYEAHEPRVHDIKQNHALCTQALAEIERRLSHEGRPLETPRE